MSSNSSEEVNGKEHLQNGDPVGMPALSKYLLFSLGSSYHIFAN